MRFSGVTGAAIRAEVADTVARFNAYGSDEGATTLLDLFASFYEWERREGCTSEWLLDSVATWSGGGRAGHPWRVRRALASFYFDCAESAWIADELWSGVSVDEVPALRALWSLCMARGCDVRVVGL